MSSRAALRHPRSLQIERKGRPGTARAQTMPGHFVRQRHQDRSYRQRGEGYYSLSWFALIHVIPGKAARPPREVLRMKTSIVRLPAGLFQRAEDALIKISISEELIYVLPELFKPPWAPGPVTGGGLGRAAGSIDTEVLVQIDAVAA